jgi:large subunit ribosomal protein L31
MKSDIHPDYREVIFKDKTADFAILTRSTIRTNEKLEWTDGKEYPVYYVDISSASHPFYTGRQTFVDSLGRVEKFRKKFGEKYEGPKPKAAAKKKKS